MANTQKKTKTQGAKPSGKPSLPVSAATKKSKKAKPPVKKTVVPPSTEASVSYRNVAAMTFTHDINNRSVRDIANAVCQYAVSLGFSSSTADNQDNDLRNAYNVICQEIYRAASGVIYHLQKHPTALREVMDALFPTRSKDGRLSVNINTGSFDTTVVELDLVKWGRPLGDYLATGVLQLESPGIVDSTEVAQESSCARVFEKMSQAGCPMLDRVKESGFLNNTCVYANFVTLDVQQDFVNDIGDGAIGVVGNEAPIRYLWLAALRLVVHKPNRQPVGNQMRVYALPGCYMAHRLIHRLVGKKARMDNIRLVTFDVNRELDLMAANAQNVIEAFGGSAKTESPAPIPFTNGDVEAYKALCLSIIQLSFFKESPVHLALQTTVPNTVPSFSLQWANQFRERGSVQGSQLMNFFINSELLKRLTCQAVKNMDGVVTTTYVIPMVKRIFPILYSPVTWNTSGVFPASFDATLFRDGANNWLVNCDTVAGTYATFFEDYSLEMNRSIPFVQQNPVNFERESIAGQHLTGLTRVVVPIDIQLLQSRALGSPSTSASNRAAAMNLKMLLDGIERRKDRKISRGCPNPAYGNATPIPNNALPIMEVGLILKSGAVDIVQKFFGLNLPFTFASMSGSSAVVESVSQACAKLGYGSYSVNKSLADPLALQLALYSSQFHRSGADANPTELMKVFASKESQGLGGLFSVVGGVVDNIITTVSPGSKMGKLSK